MTLETMQHIFYTVCDMMCSDHVCTSSQRKSNHVLFQTFPFPPLNRAWVAFRMPDRRHFGACGLLRGHFRTYGKWGRDLHARHSDAMLIACPNNASCKSDFSGCASCQNGTGKCNGNKILKCINGEYQEIECKTGAHCEAKDSQIQCVQHDCENDQQRSQGNIIQKCDNYKWTNFSACENGEQCKESDGQAACSCISGTAYCKSGKRAKICENGFLKSITCDTDYHCVKNGASVACVEEDN